MPDIRPAASGAITRDDLTAAISAGVVDERQAARLLGLARTRQTGMAGDDEPFEMFRGFGEIFIALGLVLLMVGLLLVLERQAGFVAAPLAFVLALYFTRRRRLALPSIVLVAVFNAALFWAADSFTGRPVGDGALGQDTMALIAAGVGVMGLTLWYRVFRLPFTLFLLGLNILGLVFLALDRTMDDAIFMLLTTGDMDAAFDLRTGSPLAIATLIFGIGAFVMGMVFDGRDPYRIMRSSACGFWLHMLAAPALTNTVAFTFYAMGSGGGNGLLIAALSAIGLLGLIIDRRGFLTACLVYAGALIGLAIRSGGLTEDSFPAVLVSLGTGVTVLGAFWSPLRSALLRHLPDFPGKRRLPPWTEGTGDAIRG